ncbi:hypothetical protein [Qaidamihabitans albus]|uniref:hypothetical protein n=1 Tax=Qaidamihabitans albus TaxID=2795733 RepID=UPI0018F1CA99|nr:hypothetical protein [Qaidamihabitans albus]
MRDAVNGWIGELLAPANVDRTVRMLVESQGGQRQVDTEQARRRLADAQAKLRRFQDAINQAQPTRRARRLRWTTPASRTH